MTRATFVKKAQKDIWSQGKKVTKVHLVGKSKGENYETYDTSVKGGKDDILLVKKGESYWQWAFRFGPKRVSKTQPKRSQLTRSEWLSNAYALEEDMQQATANDQTDLESLKDEWLRQIEELRDEAESRRSNMPESLQDSGSGETLQEYYDAFDAWCNELDGIDTDIDEDGIRADAAEEITEEDERVKDGADLDDLIQEKFDELLSDKVAEILGEMQGTSSGL